MIGGKNFGKTKMPIGWIFWNKNEKEYWETITPQKHWNNLKNQSEAFLVCCAEKNSRDTKNKKSAIFEGVNILPHLAHRDLNFPGIVLLGQSIDVIFERCKKIRAGVKPKNCRKKKRNGFLFTKGKHMRKKRKIRI